MYNRGKLKNIPVSSQSSDGSKVIENTTREKIVKTLSTSIFISNADKWHLNKSVKGNEYIEKQQSTEHSDKAKSLQNLSKNIIRGKSVDKSPIEVHNNKNTVKINLIPNSSSSDLTNEELKSKSEEDLNRRKIPIKVNTVDNAYANKTQHNKPNSRNPDSKTSPIYNSTSKEDDSSRSNSLNHLNQSQSSYLLKSLKKPARANMRPPSRSSNSSMSTSSFSITTDSLNYLNEADISSNGELNDSVPHPSSPNKIGLSSNRQLNENKKKINIRSISTASANKSPLNPITPSSKKSLDKMNSSENIRNDPTVFNFKSFSRN